ncbi:MAG: ABC transporter ATP-binding protein [Pseudomonadota bacterium]
MRTDKNTNEASKPWLDPQAAPLIDIRNLTKAFGDVPVVRGVDLQVYAGELFAILGGSGCGKTTLLRMLAGFEKPTSGQILIDGEDTVGLPPYELPVNMMFQSYAVFPHMTVGKNVAYGLVKAGVAKAEIETRVSEMLERVQLADYRQRKPHQLSGGQLQRVALARALIKRPKVLLLDEPLAALDKKLREETQFELMNIQHELGVTFIVVTHDQEEAMTLATRIAVMRDGQLVQTGTPTEVYEFPSNRFVAEFFGTTNVINGRVEAVTENDVRLSTADMGLLTAERLADDHAVIDEGAEMMIAIRPEKIAISKDPITTDVNIKGVIWDLGYYGNRTLYRVKIAGSERIVQVSGQNSERISQRALDWNDEVYLSWKPDNCILLKE